MNGNNPTLILTRIQEEFFKKLQEKTSWGRNELKTMYMEVKNKVLIEHLQQLEKNV